MGSGQQRGQQHPELGLIWPEASENFTIACGKTSEGFGQDLEPLARFQRGWAMSGLLVLPLYLGEVGGGHVQGSFIFLQLWILWPLGCWW